MTKATVSITFNNSDRETSPVGYEHCEQITVTRQVVIGGRNKYLINGHVAQPSRVQNLFHSVQLNVNNPHFLIMQGRITKVLNMKPMEILSMLEEAAGTRMYETKKEGALKTLAKKEAKVEEIDSVLQQEILPALEKLRKERAAYMEWATSNSEIDQLKRYIIAFEYSELKKIAQGYGTDEMKAELSTVNEEEQEVKANIAEKVSEMKELEKEREKEMTGELRALSDEVDRMSIKYVAAVSNYENQAETLKSEAESLEKLKTGVEVLQRAAASKSEESAKLEKSLELEQKEIEAKEHAVKAAECELAGAIAGDGRDESNRSMAERLADAQSAEKTSISEAEQAELKIKHCSKEITAAKKALGSKEKELKTLKTQLEKEQAAITSLQDRIDSLNFDSNKKEMLEASLNKAISAASATQDKVDELQSSLANVDFRYADPEKGFDRSRVKGVVAKLVRVKDPATTTALEVAAGGKLYNVVVDNEITAKSLLSKGKLRNRVTIIPLNKINDRMCPPSVQDSAKKISGQKASLALSLVGYEEELSAAMKYVFGNTFVCKDSDSAKAVAFNKEVYTSCVTLDGDLFNPAGTLTGGSRSATSSVLTRLHKLTEAEEELHRCRADVQRAKAELQNLESSSKEFNKLSKELELKRHALSLLEAKAKDSVAQQLADSLANLEKELEAAMSQKAEALDKQKAAKDSAEKLVKDIKEFSSKRDQIIKASKKKLEKAKQNLATAKEAIKGHEGRVKELAFEREAAERETKDLEHQIATAETAQLALQQEVKKLLEIQEDLRSQFEGLQAELDTKKAKVKVCDSESAALAEEKEQLEKKLHELGLRRKSIVHSLSKAEKEVQDAAKKLTMLQEENEWIVHEEHLFGQAGSAYDWSTQDPRATRKRYDKLMEQQENSGKKVNKKAMGMFDKAEAEYKDLAEKKRIVMKDKEKIQAVIAELDEKKKEALYATWTKVNKDFGSIFSMLLPGTNAKLEPEEGRSFLDGLEVRVAFGSVWKQSLTELSGGQRSLLALSLILSLLLFKPAPLYILDEVDAALDLSHTQNIGRMIKTHFPYSQFIVVSLKDGMFNNANVIFRTKFVDGVSTVTRTVPQLKDRQKSHEAAEDGIKRKRGVLKENVIPSTLS